MKIELVQGFQILFEKAKNIEFLMERMEKSSADLLIFGELFLTGYSIMDNMHELAERRDSKVIKEIGEKARETRKNVIFGMIEEDELVKGIYYNSAFFIDKKGYLQAKSGANFHGQPLATVIDYVKLSLTSLGLITDKRVFSLLDRYLNNGLPANLAYDYSKGDTGLMLTQYASAARSAESRVISTPASIMSVSTSANQEDFVSMASIGVLNLRKIIYNTQIIVGVELLCALRGLQMTFNKLPEDLRRLGNGTSKIYKLLNEKLPPVKEDQYMRLEMELAINIIKSGELVAAVLDLL